MTAINIGDAVPDFQGTATGDKTIKLSDYLGRHIVVYFYPKDNTPGCTEEGQGFRDNFDKFLALDTLILGVSRDSVRSHEGFKCKQEFPFDLLSDSDEKICNLFDVIKTKNMYGKQVLGIERSTFLISPEGVLVREWRKVKVKNHVEEVLQALQQLSTQ